MDKKLKRALKQAFAPPPPERKAAFLRTHRRRDLGPAELLLTQAGYVRWWTWAGSCALFAAILMLALSSEARTVWSSSALTPLLALIAVSETSRARRYGMEELELSCRMPRSAAMLARMAAVGLLHLVLLGITAPILSRWGEVGVLRTGVYLLTPYLLTAALGMELSRRVRGQEGLLACTAAAVLVCVLGMWALSVRPELYQSERIRFWWVVLALTLTASVFEFVQTVKETEELQWT